MWITYNSHDVTQDNSHVNHMRFTCKTQTIHMRTTCKLHTIHMQTITIHMWITCKPHTIHNRFTYHCERKRYLTPRTRKEKRQAAAAGNKKQKTAKKRLKKTVNTTKTTKTTETTKTTKKKQTSEANAAAKTKDSQKQSKTLPSFTCNADAIHMWHILTHTRACIRTQRQVWHRPGVSHRSDRDARSRHVSVSLHRILVPTWQHALCQRDQHNRRVHETMEAWWSYQTRKKTRCPSFLTGNV